MKRPELLAALSLCVGLALATGAPAQDTASTLKQLAEQLDIQQAEKAQLERRLREELAAKQGKVDELTAELQRLRRHVAEVQVAARQQAAAAATPKRQYRVFTLKNARAVPTAELLRGLLPEDQAKAVRTMPDERTNSVVVNAPAADLEEIEALLTRLDQTPGVKPAPLPDKTP